MTVFSVHDHIAIRSQLSDLVVNPLFEVTSALAPSLSQSLPASPRGLLPHLSSLSTANRDSSHHAHLARWLRSTFPPSAPRMSRSETNVAGLANPLRAATDDDMRGTMPPCRAPHPNTHPNAGWLTTRCFMKFASQHLLVAFGHLMHSHIGMQVFQAHCKRFQLMLGITAGLELTRHHRLLVHG